MPIPLMALRRLSSTDTSRTTGVEEAAEVAAVVVADIAVVAEAATISTDPDIAADAVYSMDTDIEKLIR